MDLLAIARIDGMRLGLITVSGISALVIDLHYHTRSNGEAVGGEPVALGRDVPALTASFTDAGDYAGGSAVDVAVAEVGAASKGEVVGGREASAVIARCGWTAGHGGTAIGVPGEGGGEDRVGTGLGVDEGEGSGEKEDGEKE